MEKAKNYNIFVFSFVTLTIISYFFGFTINENSAGGGEVDFKNTWRNLQTFKNYDLLDALKQTAVLDIEIFRSSRIPGVYVFHKFLNPFFQNKEEFRLSVFLFSILIPVSFYFALGLRFKETDKLSILLISSLIFLSPYFRTSAIWGNEENFGLLSLILSYIFFELFFSEKKSFKKLLYLNLLIFISAVCVYFDQKLIFVPALCFVKIIFSNENNLIKIYSTLFYSLLALPVLYIFYLWGGIMPPFDGGSRVAAGNNLYFQHINYSTSIIGFYLLPLLLLIKDYSKNLKNLFSHKGYLLFLVSILIYSIYFIFFYEINSESFIGKGIFYKLSLLIFNNFFLQKIFLSIIFIFLGTIIYFYSNIELGNKVILIFLIISSIFYTPVLQEYFDPLILILFFTFLNLDIKISNQKVIFVSLFFSFIFIFSFIYYRYYNFWLIS